VPAHYRDSTLNTADIDEWPASTAASAPGSPALDAPVLAGGRGDWLLRHLGPCFTVVVFSDQLVEAATSAAIPARWNDMPIATVVVAREEGALPSSTVLVDREGLAFSRYAPDGEAIYLFRPDQHVAGRRIGHRCEWITSAIARASMQHPTKDIHGNAERRTEPVAAG
jgi:3-(3-hydroxy-phenyl)propionate hydroxylase